MHTVCKHPSVGCAACVRACVLRVCRASCVHVNLQGTDLVRPSTTVITHTISRSRADTETNRSSPSTCTDSFTVASFDPVAYAPCQHLATFL